MQAEARSTTNLLSCREQIAPADIAALAAAGFRSIICNRPDGEGADQPVFAEIEAAARAAGLEAPLSADRLGQGQRRRCGRVRRGSWPSCRSRCCLLPHRHALGDAVVAVRRRARTSAARDPRGHQGGRLRHERRGRAHRQWRQDADRRRPMPRHEVVIIGGGAAGIAVALKPDGAQARSRHRHHRPGRHPLLPAGLDHGRRRRLRSADDRPDHGVASSRRASTGSRRRSRRSSPRTNAVILDGCRVVKYRR